MILIAMLKIVVMVHYKIPYSETVNLFYLLMKEIVSTTFQEDVGWMPCWCSRYFICPIFLWKVEVSHYQNMAILQT